MKLAIGCDHGGFQLKEAIKKHLEQKNIEVEDYGTYSKDSVNFPVYATKVGHAVTSGTSDLGILCCGTGIGMSIAANKIDGVRAAVVSDTFSAQATREHNNSNVLCLGERVVGEGLALLIVDTWLNAGFQGGRHQERIDQVTEIEKRRTISI
ncbi:ribose 5-phosphate isomerase B [Bacillus sp. T3]|uniref:ribose 5-phosphate isomerase B n=1 Tax=Bacillus sp. T3 TaxID=467262 RepID=UPI0029820265|nr:ribose 5-phosphate isomerase B [Bacillus sp. T3]